MAHQPAALGSFTQAHPLLISMLLAAAIIAAMLVLTAIFGVNARGPSFELAPDPAGPMLPF